MKRDVRLHGLSSDHHAALGFARALARKLADPGEAARARGTLAERFRARLEPHFRIEEDVLLPALEAAGEGALAERTASDHAALRELALGPAADGEAAGDRLREFATLLEDHVRFEEHELFPACERLLADAVLEAVAVRAPKPVIGRAS